MIVENFFYWFCCINLFVVYLFKETLKINTMTPKMIMTSVYSLERKQGKETMQFIRAFEYLHTSDFNIENSDVKSLIPSLLIIAKREKLNLRKYEHFEMAVDILKYSVSWN